MMSNNFCERGFDVTICARSMPASEAGCCGSSVMWKDPCEI